ncbi:hypothetical protein ACAW74_20245 [Fibrella sp. WM1]|uniref:hypothetical protein n=1 Tax=Fibrella musci TaxID=3242485 RepID=UPI003522EF6A
MKTTKRTIAASAKTSAVFQRIIADKKALRERWATGGQAPTPLANGQSNAESLPLH